MTSAAELIDDLDFEPFGGPLTHQFESRMEGKSPFNGSLFWLAQFELHEEAVNGVFTASIRDQGQVARKLEHPSRFRSIELLLRHVESLLELDSQLLRSAVDLREVLCSYGYRMVVHHTGRRHGHINTTTIVADAVTELDAALQLQLEPDTVLDLLDGGSDPMREHVKFGAPYAVAQSLAARRPEYNQVLDYMRSYGAH